MLFTASFNAPPEKIKKRKTQNTPHTRPPLSLSLCTARREGWRAWPPSQHVHYETKEKKEVDA